MALKNSRPSSKAHQPLSGLCILVGRARHQASALSFGLRNLGAKVVEIPFIEIRKPKTYKPLDSSLKDLPNYDWLILTSVNGVDAVWQRLRKCRVTRKHFKHLKVAAIGPATKKVIEARGLRVNVVPKEYVAESVVESLRDHVPGKRVLLARAKVARDVIPRELRKLGAIVDVVEAYETVIPKSSRTRLRALLKDSKSHPDVITFTSSSSVRNFVALLGKNMWRGHPRPRNSSPLENVKLASIGPVTSSTLRELHLPVDIEAAQFTIPGLIKAVTAGAKSKHLSS